MTEAVLISPEFQVVIPHSVREALNIQPGQEFLVIPYQNRIELIPVRPIKKARGFLKGIDTSTSRGADRL